MKRFIFILLIPLLLLTCCSLRPSDWLVIVDLRVELDFVETVMEKRGIQPINVLAFFNETRFEQRLPGGHSIEVIIGDRWKNTSVRRSVIQHEGLSFFIPYQLCLTGVYNEYISLPAFTMPSEQSQLMAAKIDLTADGLLIAQLTFQDDGQTVESTHRFELRRNPAAIGLGTGLMDGFEWEPDARNK